MKRPMSLPTSARALIVALTVGLTSFTQVPARAEHTVPPAVGTANFYGPYASDGFINAAEAAAPNPARYVEWAGTADAVKSQGRFTDPSDAIITGGNCGPYDHLPVSGNTGYLPITCMRVAPEGEIRWQVRWADAAGNFSGYATDTIIVDRIAPEIGTVEWLDADGVMNEQESLRPPGNAIRVRLTGTADHASAKVSFTNADGTVPATCANLAAPTTGELPIPSACATALTDGTIFVVAIWSDIALNPSLPATDDLLKDTLAPTTPVITAPDDGAAFTPGTFVTVRGTAQPNHGVRLVDSNGEARLTAADSGGAWSVPLGQPSTGSHFLSARAVDAAGNLSDAGTAVFYIDRLIPIIVTPCHRCLVPGLATVTGTGEPGSTVDILEGPTQIGRAIVTSSGNWSGDIGVSSGDHTIRARATDPLGRVSAFSDPRTFVADASRPVATISTPDRSVFNPGSPVAISGTSTDTGPAGNFGVTRVELRYIDLVRGVTVATENATCPTCGPEAASATWSSSPTLPTGLYIVQAVAVDLAGNRSNSASISILRL